MPWDAPTVIALAALAVALPCGILSLRAWRLLGEAGRLSPHARLLGRRVEVRKYDGSDWEAAVVVCVSHHGSLCIRRDGERRGWWMDSHRVPGRVRLLEER
jgi:hypothetical protein